MTPRAILLVLRVEALLAVMAFPAEITFGYLVHIHLGGTLGHLEYLIVTSSALQAFSNHMLLMTENDR